MLFRIVAMALASTLALASVTRADPVPSGVATPIRESVARLTFTAPVEARRQPAPQRDSGRLVRKIIVASTLGFGGFLAGGRIGALIDGDCGGCDDPGLKGALIGAPIGGTIAAIVGWKITK